MGRDLAVDLVRREALADRRRIGWMTGVLVVPVLGPVIYLLGGGSAIGRPVRPFLAFGALAIYLVVAAVALLVQAT